MFNPLVVRERVEPIHKINEISDSVYPTAQHCTKSRIIVFALFLAYLKVSLFRMYMILYVSVTMCVCLIFSIPQNPISQNNHKFVHLIFFAQNTKIAPFKKMFPFIHHAQYYAYFFVRMFIYLFLYIFYQKL